MSYRKTFQTAYHENHMDEKHFCPNCGSRNIDSDVDGFVKRRANPDMWLCNNCGYNGFMPVGDPDNYDFENPDHNSKPSEAELDAEFGNMSHIYQKISLVLILTGILLALTSILI